MLLSFVINTVPLALSGAESPPWWNYPGFELWKFVNLGIFVLLMVYFLTRKFKVGEAFKNRREGIRQELARAEQERDSAMAKLKEVEERFQRIDDEVSALKEVSVRETAAERERIARDTETEIAKLAEQAQREIERAGKTARHELRRHTAEESVRLAEELIRREMKPADDVRLITRNIEDLGGAAR